MRSSEVQDLYDRMGGWCTLAQNLNMSVVNIELARRRAAVLPALEALVHGSSKLRSGTH